MARRRKLTTNFYIEMPIPSNREIFESNQSSQPGDEIFKIVAVGDDEAKTLPTESVAFKASGHPSILELMMNKFEAVDRELEALKENSKSYEQKVEVLTRQNVNFTINFYVLGLVQTVLDLDKILIRKYLPRSFSVLRREDLQFRDLLQARSNPELTRGIEEMLKKPLVISLRNLLTKKRFNEFQIKRNEVAHSPIHNLAEFDRSFEFLSENASFLHDENLDNFLWIKNNFPEIRELIVKLKQ